MLYRDDVGDDVHDEGRKALVGGHALHQLLHRRRLLLQRPAGYSRLQLLDVGRVLARPQEERAHAHINYMCSNIIVDCQHQQLATPTYN